MTHFMTALAGLGSHAWLLIVAHFQVAYYLALVVATPAVLIGQATEPMLGRGWANALSMVLSWATFLGAYSFVRKGGLNPALKKLWPWREWSGPWWKWNWAAALASLVRRRWRGKTPPTPPETAVTAS